MEYLDILLEETRFKTDANGQFDIADNAAKIASNVVFSDYGSYKYAPTVGGRANSFLNSSTRNNQVIVRSFKVALSNAGFVNPIVTSSQNSINVTTNNPLT